MPPAARVRPVSSAHVDTAGRRARLNARLGDVDADAFLVTRLPNVRYLTGFTGSNGQLILTRDEALFLTDGRYAEQSRHQVRDIRRTIYTGQFPPVFTTTCSDLNARRVAFEADGVTHQSYLDMAEAGVDLVPTRGEVERLRWIKEPSELDLLGQAQAIADESFRELLDLFTVGISERMLAFEVELSMRRGGADGPAFDSIVAFGPNTAEPHHRPTARELHRGDLVKLDFGCVVDGYHSDMTRTVAFGDPSGKLREVYEVVRLAQRAGIDAVRAGVTGAEADRAARDVIAEAGYGDRYTHSLGHGVGLEVHEGPNLRAGGTDVLPAGAVVTVEPGIYLEGQGGVRIEDMVEVLDTGGRVIPSVARELLVL
jgi:Xaa-Pro aminopeptidase